MVGSPRLLAKANPNTSRYRRGLLTARAGLTGVEVKVRGAAVASRWAAHSITGGPLSLNFVSTLLSRGACAVSELAACGAAACTGAGGISGANPQISAVAKCKNRWRDMGKATRTLGPAAGGGQSLSGTRSGLEDCAFGSRADEQGVPGEHALSVMRFGRGPAPQPLRQIDSLDRELSLRHVDGDDIAVLQRRERSADRRLGRDVPDHQAASRAREPTVRDHRHGVAESFADDRRGHLQHLAHSRSAARTFVADHHRVSGLDLAADHRRKRILLAIEDTRGPAVRCRRVLGDLDHRTLRRERAAQDDKTTLVAQRPRQRGDNLLAGCLTHRLALLAQRSAGDRQGVTVDEAAFDEAAREQADATGAMQLHSREATARLEVAQQRRAAADAIDLVDVELDPDLAREGKQVEHRVG